MRITATILFLWFLLPLSAQEFTGRVVKNMAELRALTPSTTKPMAQTLGYYAPGDGGGGTYVLTNTVAGTNAYGGRVVALGGGRSWDLSDPTPTAGQFGAVPTAMFNRFPYTQSTNLSLATGTSDFSVWIRFTVPAYSAARTEGMFALRSATNLVRAFELIAAPSLFGLSIRNTVGGSSTGALGPTDAGTFRTTTNPLLGLTGTTADIVVTRSGTNLAVYLNGADITGTLTYVNQQAFGADVGGTGIPTALISGLSSFQFLASQPILYAAYWPRVLTSGEAVSPLTAASPTARYQPTNTTLTDYSANIQAGIDFLAGRGGGVLRLTPGTYRSDNELRLKPNVVLKGSGAFYSEDKSTIEEVAGAARIMPWFYTTNKIVGAYGSDAQQYGMIPVASAPFGLGDGSLAWPVTMSAEIKDIALDGSCQDAGYGINLDQVYSVIINNVSINGNRQAAVRAFGCNVLDFQNIYGNPSLSKWGYGIQYIGCADNIIRGCQYGGTYGPVLQLNGANKNVVDGNVLFNTVQQFAVRGPFTMNTANGIITKTAHGFQTGDVVSFDVNTGDSLPSPLNTNAVYYAFVIDADTLKVNTQYTQGTSVGGALQGVGITNTTAGSGTFYIQAGPAVNVQVYASDNNTITDNRFDQSVYDNLVLNTASESVVSGNILSENGFTSGDINAAAIRLKAGSVNNTITANSAEKRGAAANGDVGIYVSANSTLNVGAGNRWFGYSRPWVFESNVASQNNYFEPWQQQLANTDTFGQLTLTLNTGGSQSLLLNNNNVTTTINANTASDTSGTGPNLSFYRSRGTIASKTAVLAGDEVLEITANARNDSGNDNFNLGRLRLTAVENQTATAQGGFWLWYVKRLGTTIEDNVLQMNSTASAITWRYGGGFSSALQNLNWYGAAATGTDIPGADLSIAPPAGTGNASANGQINFLTPDTGTTGATAQTITPKVRVTKAGSLDILTAGQGIRVKEGSNAKMGTATLVAGSVVVANTSVTATSRIILTSNLDGGTPGWLRVSARTAGTSFTITSSSGTDTSTVAWVMLEPAP